MNIVALIPARSGSKRLVNKNIKLLGGKPLINWSINIALQIHLINEVIVSTDSPQIAKIAKEAGACVPWIRPIHLAQDHSSSFEVAMHALNWFENRKIKVDGILLLQPTSPYRKIETVTRGIELFIDNNKRPVIGVKTIINPHLKIYQKRESLLHHIFEDYSKKDNNKKNFFEVTGSFYLMSPEDLLEYKTFVPPVVIPLMMANEETIDIDTEWDFEVAQNLLLNHKNS